MSNDNEQENNNELKVISKIEPKFKNKNLTGDDIVHAQNLYQILDKLIKDLNEGFVPELDGVLNSIKSELNELRDEMPEITLAPGSTTGEENWLL